MEAKVSACDTGPRVTQLALEVCGGQAYTPSLPISATCATRGRAR